FCRDARKKNSGCAHGGQALRASWIHDSVKMSVQLENGLSLEMRGVRKHFGATQALSGVDLAVRAGSVMALVGENGAGKSTLMKVLSGAHAPDAGEMRLDGEPYAPADPLE